MLLWHSLRPAWSRGMPLRHPAGDGLRLMVTTCFSDIWKNRWKWDDVGWCWMMMFNVWWCLRNCENTIDINWCFSLFSFVLLRNAPLATCHMHFGFHRPSFHLLTISISNSDISDMFLWFRTFPSHISSSSHNVSRISGLGHIEVPGCFPWHPPIRRFAVTSRPELGDARRLVRHTSPTAEWPRHRGLCQALKHVRQTKSSKSLNLTCLGTGHYMTLYDII